MENSLCIFQWIQIISDFHVSKWLWYWQLCSFLGISFRLKLYYLSYITTVQQLYWYVVLYFLCSDLGADTTACLPYLISDPPLPYRYDDGSMDYLTLTSVSDPYPHTCCPASCFWPGGLIAVFLLCSFSQQQSWAPVPVADMHTLRGQWQD